MRLIDLLKNEDLVFYQGLHDSEYDLKISSNIEDIDEKTVYFHIRRVGKNEYVFPDYSASHPFVTVCEEGIEGNIDDHPTVIVKNVRKALAYAYSQECKIDYSKIKIDFQNLSSGTTKGILLYTLMVASLKEGFDLLIDEVENHFHKTLVENMISLYKDKGVNRKNATLIFTTHYCEVLDQMGRQDNIWVCNANSHIHLAKMYEVYHIRPALLKSKQYYNNAFRTAVNYDDLMALKKVLKK